jgi:tetratricopeptide (TPR) repeat protein
MDYQAEINLARIVASQNKSDEAILILRGVIQNDPRNAEAWLALSEVIENPERVKQCLERVLQLDPGNSAAHQRLARGVEPDPEIPLFLQGVEDQEVGWGQPRYLDSPTKEPTGTEPINSEPLFQPPSQPSQPQEGSKSQNAGKSPKEKKPSRVLEFSLIGIVVTFLCVIVTVVILPQSGTLLSAKPTPTIEDPTQVIYENIRAANAEDLDAYMATIYPRTLVMAATESTLKDLNKQYDLQYRLSGLKILEQDKKETRVAFTLITRKIRGPEFQNNRVTGVFILRMHEGRWKIYDQEIETVDYIN